MEPSNDDSLIAALCITGFGILALLFARFLRKREFRDYTKYKQTEATFIDIQVTEENGYYMYTSTFEYTTSDGQRLTTKVYSQSKKDNASERLGSKFTIYYDPEKPTKYKSEAGRKSDRITQYALTVFATLFITTGLILFGTIDYMELELVQRYFVYHPPTPPHVTRIGAAFQKYEDSLVDNNIYPGVFDCDPARIRHMEVQPKHKISIAVAQDLVSLYARINEDTLTDCFLGIIPSACDGSPTDSTLQLKYLILSRDTNYYVVDNYFNFRHLDSLGKYKIEKIENGQFVGSMMLNKSKYPLKEFVSDSSIIIPFPRSR